GAFPDGSTAKISVGPVQSLDTRCEAEAAVIDCIRGSSLAVDRVGACAEVRESNTDVLVAEERVVTPRLQCDADWRLRRLCVADCDPGAVDEDVGGYGRSFAVDAQRAGPVGCRRRPVGCRANAEQVRVVEAAGVAGSFGRA